jgi:hypothetical protein
MSVPEGSYEHGGSSWLEQASHVLDGQGVYAMTHQLIRQLQVVLQIILRIAHAWQQGSTSGTTCKGSDPDHTAHCTCMLKRLNQLRNMQRPLQVVIGIILHLAYTTLTS